MLELDLNREIGIIGYGAYIPLYRIKDEEIGRVWGRRAGFPVEEKAVAGLDEDVVTMAIEASLNALKRAQINPKELGAVLVGTESKPYAVKPSGTIVAEAIGATPATLSADYEFACKAGTEALQTCIALVKSGMCKYALAIGGDTAQGRPSDELEYTAASGAAAYIVGPKDEALATFEASFSYVTDTPDFWRRQVQPYPKHTGRFTGEPAYFKHIISAAKMLFEKYSFSPEDFDYAVFHQPNLKFPIRVAKKLGFPMEKIKPGLVVGSIGNTYAGSSLIGLAATLDVAKPGQRILVVSFGSGAGSDAFSLVVEEAIEVKRDRAPGVVDYIERKRYVDYATYARFRGKILR